MDELYIIAREVLLDALEALGPHKDATILVGAQAIYLHTGAADIAVAEYTTDADLAIDPDLLDDIPPLEQALEQAGFLSSKDVGIWKTRRKTTSAANVDVQVDLLVPSAVSPGKGRRAARLPGHNANAARKVDGLEGVLVDKSEIEIHSLQPDEDPRKILTQVAGPGALLVAKLFKIHERRGSERSNDKDALDIYRLLQAITTQELANCIGIIRADERSAAIGSRSIELLEELFGTRGSEGAIMAARATQPLMDADEVRQTCEFLTSDLLRELG